MPIIADLGDFRPGDTVRFAFVAAVPFGGANVGWVGIAEVVRPDGQSTEAGVSFGPAPGNRLSLSVDLAATADTMGAEWLAPGRYLVALTGDPVGVEPINGVPAAHFTLATS